MLWLLQGSVILYVECCLIVTHMLCVEFEKFLSLVRSITDTYYFTLLFMSAVLYYLARSALGKSKEL